MKKLIIIFLLVCFLAPIVLAANNSTTNTTNATIDVTPTIISNITNTTTSNITTNITTNITVVPTHSLPLPEEFYGDIIYSDGTKVATGSEIRALDQNGKLIGNFTMTMNGTYGDSYKSAPRLIVHGTESGDIITFYVGNIKSSNTMKFDIGGIKRADITISSFYKPTPTPTPTPEPTPIPTTIAIQNLTLPTTTILTIPPTSIATSVPVTTIAQNNTPSLQLDNITIKFTGVILVAIGVCVAGAILTYYILTKKMKREDEEEIHL
jgi:hypothetical protein